ncbi:MAG TPA: alpha-L-fucosidase [Verrucomicrobiae bacterium]|nr:alpha-L-fucosidase [Verrucomicrobiae bacterium]
MKQLPIIVSAGCLWLAAPFLDAQPFPIPPKNSPKLEWWRDSMKTHDARIAWWRDARFGMFIHWGVYSSLGNEFHGRKGGTYAEHIQRVLKIPIAAYRKEVAGNFNPTNFNAEAWVRAAKDAGMGYMIITAKHHDGFAMWPSAVSPYNITNCTPFKRDPMAELSAACRKYGLRFGFYYSQAFDWSDENAPGNDWDYHNPGGDKLIGGRRWWETTPEFLPKARKYVDQKAIPQLQELIRRYDPDILWFDTSSKLPESENLRIMRAVRAASARVVINGRLVRGLGDYSSTADRPADFAPHEADWEGIPTTNESYGWNRFDHSHKPPSHFIRLLAKAAARGGNILMNVGPMGDGRMDPKDLAILDGIGAWWKLNGESIRGTTRSPLAVQSWGESTLKGNTLYLHVFDWPASGKLVVGGLMSAVKTAHVLSASPCGPLTISRLNPLDLTITGLPAAPPEQADSVIALECTGEIQSDPRRLLQPAMGSETLRVFDAVLHGKALKFGPGKTRDAHVTGWTNPGECITWPARINEPAVYEVSVTYDAQEQSAGKWFTVEFGSQVLKGQITPGAIQTTALGRVSLKPGRVEIKLSTQENSEAELMQPRLVILKTLGR